MDRYVIRRPSAWASLEELEAAGAKSAEIGDAQDPESIREHARRTGMPGDQIFPVVATVVIREDSAEASAAA
jgi:hypothetical protein